MSAQPVLERDDRGLLESTANLVGSLRVSHSLGSRTRPVKVIETHISYILLVGNYAYKIKKPIDLEFLNFKTIKKRLFYCKEELRLNRRTAPDIYLDVVPITGSQQNPKIGGRGTPIEYAVKMRRFDETKQLDHLLDADDITPKHIDHLASDLVDFHRSAAAADKDSHFSKLEALRERAMQNFEELASYDAQSNASSELEYLRQWTEASLAKRGEYFQRRKQLDCIRECHGDLHLGNMFLERDRVVVFDCVEFSEDLRWIDVMSDLAFLVMDLDYRDRQDLSRRVLNKYLEHSGDYDGLSVLTHYLVYRALVRAKIAWIRHQQVITQKPLHSSALQEVNDYIALALRYTQAHTQMPLVITHGVSGTGKSYVSELLVSKINAIQLRSDVERKRSQNVTSVSQDAGGINQGAYTADATQHTYARLLELARNVIRCGYPVVVDATFLTCGQRTSFRNLAHQLGVPFKILDLQAPYAVLKERIDERLKQGKDPSEANIGVLDHQMRFREALTPEELLHTIHIDTDQTIDIAQLSQQVVTVEN